MVEIKKSERVQKEKQAPLFEDLPDSPLPPLTLLDEPADDIETLSRRDARIHLAPDREEAARLRRRGEGASPPIPGPVITRYEIEPAVGVKGSQIVNLVKDLARALSVVSHPRGRDHPRQVVHGPGDPQPASARSCACRRSSARRSTPTCIRRSTLALGKDIAGNPVVADLARMPHLLVAGTTGSGKSVAINAMILSLLYKADAAQVRLILIDPKMLELSVYEGIPHLLAPVVTDMKQAANALNWCVGEMERRYKLMSRARRAQPRRLQPEGRARREKAGSRSTNPFTLDAGRRPSRSSELPLIVVVIDELADLMMVVGKKVEELIARLAQKARAAGIHLILATQRPSVDVITGLIKANIPTRIAFQVSSKVDSRTILDQMGAEALLGQGDMLYLPPGTGYAAARARRLRRRRRSAQGGRVPEDAWRSRSTSTSVLESRERGGRRSGGVEGGRRGEADPLYDQAVRDRAADAARRRSRWCSATCASATTAPRA